MFYNFLESRFIFLFPLLYPHKQQVDTHRVINFHGNIF